MSGKGKMQGDRREWYEYLVLLRRAAVDPQVMLRLRRRGIELMLGPDDDDDLLERLAHQMHLRGFPDVPALLAGQANAWGPHVWAGDGGEDPPGPQPGPGPRPQPQPEEKAHLVVMVADADGRPVQDAQVSASGLPTRPTDATGKVDYGEVTPGSYTVSATKPNHAPVRLGAVGADSKTVSAPAGSTVQADLVQHEQWRVEFVTPGVDPIRHPNSTVGHLDQNEYTYSTATPGILTITLRARVIPADRVSEAQPHVKFEVPVIDGSPLTWDGAGDGTATTVNGDMLEAVATYTGLPATNNKFGRKTAKLFRLNAEVGTRTFEVFFPRDARNHPNPGQGTTPNWFFYWRPLTGVRNLTWAGNSGTNKLAEVRGMINWNYASAPDKTRLYIYRETLSKSPYQPYSVGVRVSGIDAFFATAIHENMHVQQINRADALVPGAGCWRHGYSWNQATHNHYGPGPDGLWGPAPGVATAAVAVQPPFVAGQGDDVSIDAADHWPTAFGAQPAAFAGSTLHAIEREAVRASDAVITADHVKARLDWGDPGKNHGTLNNWNT